MKRNQLVVPTHIQNGLSERSRLHSSFDTAKKSGKRFAEVAQSIDTDGEVLHDAPSRSSNPPHVEVERTTQRVRALLSEIETTSNEIQSVSDELETAESRARKQKTFALLFMILFVVAAFLFLSA